VLERWSEGRLADEMAAAKRSFRKAIDGLDEEETLVLKWLSNAGNGVG
jgi:DNA topoisomerase-1